MSIQKAEANGVVHADAKDFAKARAHALSSSGQSYRQLQEQAKTGQYVSMRARLAWIAVGDLPEDANDSVQPRRRSRRLRRGTK
jgi:hypothetical protein